MKDEIQRTPRPDLEEATALAKRNLSEGLQRLEKALAPAMTEVLSSQVSDEPSEAATADEAFTLTAQAIVSRFVTANGALGGDEAAVLAEVSRLPAVSEESKAQWSLLDTSDVLQSAVGMGSTAMDCLTPFLQALLEIQGDQAAEELIQAALDVARATCDLDGRDSEEELALVTFESELQDALAFFKKKSS